MRLLVALFALLMPALVTAQDRANTILVLDGSGSMWGQIEGINKIVIAREVVGTLLDDFPADQNLGLTVYGHRSRGDCADIETVVAPDTGTTGAIREAVNAINPRGKTPMTDAIIAAAEALRYTEERATVILVSDGIETCNPDPCAAALALEEAGIDFTAHVVGFDVTDPEALAQMQCLADNTGGTFTTASNALELTTALQTVAVDPAPLPRNVVFLARMGADGPMITEDLNWTVTGGPDGAYSDVTTDDTFTLVLDPADYRVAATWAETGQNVVADFAVPEGAQEDELTVTLVFDEPEPVVTPVTFEARMVAEDGTLIATPVFWDVASDAGVVAEGEAGNPLTLDLLEGSHVVTAYWAEQEVEATRQFIVTPDPRTIVMTFEEPAMTATITAPAAAPIGATIEVGWNGPDLEGDYLGISAEGEDRWDNFAYTRDGNPATLLMPVEPGPHEIQYFLGDGREIIGTTMIELTDVPFSITAPETAEIGQMVEIAWVGPDYDSDYIGIGPVGEGKWDNFTYTRAGNPLLLQMPPEPGDYEISYFMNQDRAQKTTVTITVTEPQVGLTAPTSAIAGSLVEVAWIGPDLENDYIGIGPLGEGKWDNFTYTREGNPLMLLMPAEPGEYEISYFLNQDRTQLVTVPITVTALEASITAPQTAIAGETIEVAWGGPDYDSDYIGIGPLGEGKWDNFTYTRDGNPLRLLMPPEPGEYEISYFMNQDRTQLVTVPITLTPAQFGVTAPATAVEGAMVEIAWVGPDYDSDYIGIGPLGEGRWDNFTYTRDGNPLMLRMPPNPGEYEISYFMNQDRFQAVTVPITVTALDYSISAPETAPAGGTIEVAWTGPNYDNDYIGIGPRGEGRWTTYAYTRDGPVLTIAVPDEPGEYEISYFLDQGRTQKITVPLTVE